jgi:phosphotransferase system IIB component
MAMQLWQYAIIIFVLIIISLVVLKLKQKDFSSEVNKLIQYLGGKDNIINAEVNMSRFKVILKDITKVNKDGITSLGAQGIVEIDNQLKIILGPNSKQLKRYIDELKKK